MKAELRADGLAISGYVNVTGRESRPVITRAGKVIEKIEPGAFKRAIERAKGKVKLLLDHMDDRILGDTETRTLSLSEDNVGLKADALITDQEVIKAAKEGRLRGWSFRMQHVVDKIEERAEGLPIRTVIDFDMPEVSLVLNKIPAYSATSIELRAEEEDETEVEIRSVEDEAERLDTVETPEETEKPDYTSYERRIAQAKIY